MFTSTLFISEDLVKQNSLIDSNMDGKLVRTVIQEAQDMHILPLIGTGVYNDLIANIGANTFTGLNQTLLDTYISSCLLYWTLYEGVDVFTFKFKNNGVVKQGADNMTQLTLEEVKRLMDRFRNKAMWYGERITRYCIQNLASFPLFANPGNGIDTVFPIRTGYTTGIYLGGHGRPISDEDRIERGIFD